MGKGDMRTKRGKIFRGTHGNSRRRKKEKAKNRRKPQGGGHRRLPPRGRRASLNMPNYWILKTEPSAYSFDRLERERTAVWDGVKNPLALKHLRAMQPATRS